MEVSRDTALLVAGVLLLGASIGVVPVLDLDGPTYRYEASQVSLADGTVDQPVRVEGVACLGGASTGRVCVFEHLAASGGIRVGAHEPVARSVRYYEYAYVDGHFYRPTKEQRNGTWYLTAERVDADVALDRLATPFRRASAPIQTAIADGTVRVDHELAGGSELVSYHGDYYVVSLTGADPAPSAGGLTEWAIAAVCFAAGLVSVLLGQRGRVAEGPNPQVTRE